jgi:cardiolipin synthase
VHRLAEALPAGLADPGFAALLGRIDGAPPYGGNRVEPYFHGEQALAAMRQAVAAARREVLLESYIFSDDATGREIMGDLARAVARGVAVRVLVDAVGSLGTRASFWREMERRGIAVRLFHPLLSKVFLHPYRDHRKILVVDRSVAFTGGMNIADEYGSSRPGKGRTWRDSHVKVEGPAAREMAAVFHEGWIHAGGDPLDLAPPQGEPCGGVCLLVLESRPNRGHAESAAALAAVVAAARARVWITNAYFAPRRIALDILGRAAARGVDVRLLLPGATDVPIVRHAGHGYFAGLLARGVRIFEYQAAILHAKTMVADGRVSVVGSSNLDFRSFQFNGECNLVILDEEIGGRMEEAFRDDLGQSAEIEAGTWSRRPLYHRLGDRLARLLAPVL